MMLYYLQITWITLLIGYRIPDDFYHKNLNEAIKLCGDKCGNYSLSLNERSSYSTLCDWLLEYRNLKDKHEN